MTRSILVCFHKYQPFGGEYYESIFDFFMMQMEKYKNEFEKLYLLDSNWGIKKVPGWAEVIQVNPHLRYYDAFKEVLPKIKADLVLFLDNDMVIYREGIIKTIFNRLQGIEKRYSMAGSYGPLERDIETDNKYDVVSIYDTIGKTFKQLGDKSKFCPYLFASKTETLMKYRDVEWGPNMPKHETLGKLTEEMLEDGLKPYEMPEDKSDFLFGEVLADRKSKDLGYMHIRAGTTPAVLLAWRSSPNHKKTYEDYLKNQPQSEYLRHFAWYQIMGGNINPILEDLKLGVGEWDEYVKNFRIFHGL